MEILGRVLETVMPSVPREEVAEVMYEFEEELADVVAKARLPLPEYYSPEEDRSEEEGEGQGSPPRIAGEAPPPDSDHFSAAVSPLGTAAASAAERQAPASVPASNDSGNARFVPPAVCPTGAQSRAGRQTCDAARCATLSAGKGQLAAAGAKS